MTKSVLIVYMLSLFHFTMNMVQRWYSFYCMYVKIVELLFEAILLLSILQEVINQLRLFSDILK
jgi:hypothetical protein